MTRHDQSIRAAPLGMQQDRHAIADSLDEQVMGNVSRDQCWWNDMKRRASLCAICISPHSNNDSDTEYYEQESVSTYLKIDKEGLEGIDLSRYILSVFATHMQDAIKVCIYS